jgi:hypothetical protein
VKLPAVNSIGQYTFESCTELATITIAKGCNINDNNNMPIGFKSYYETNTQHVANAVGVYTYNGDVWSYEPLQEKS